MTYETILFEKKNHVATIVLNRPHRMNAFDRQMGIELKSAWEDVKADDETWVVIVTAEGERAFCAGVDVTEVAALGGIATELHPRNLRITAHMNGVWKPVITAVNGLCIGGGLHFVADSDIVICSENASFFDTHLRVGQVFAMEAVGLARRIPFEAVLRMMLLAGEERIDAQRALQLGLVSEVVPLANLRARAEQLAAVITKNSPATMMASKRAIWEGQDRGLSEALDNAIRAIEEHWRHPDYLEGPRAFAEKRTPKWTVTGETHQVDG